VSVKDVLFIDANQYLDLYRTNSGKKLLPALEEQRNYIFVTKQVVDEVFRNKVEAAKDFLISQAKNVEPDSVAVPVPEDFLGVARTCARLCRLWWSRRFAKMPKRRTTKEFKKRAHELLEQVSLSEDDISTALEPIFAKAIAPEAEELQGAKKRKAHGNAPGKKNGPLGDELSWEQILSILRKSKGNSRLWVITRDSDYATKYAGETFLNAALYRELGELELSLEVFCFSDIDTGLRRFAATAKVKAEKLPTPEEAEQIKKEQESLTPLGWLINYDDSGFINLRLQDANRMRDAATVLVTPWLNQVVPDEVIPPPATNEADKGGT
jgi:hypothetical protein